jgi:prepilin-type N-terminal cleavage/methylation domain-containing protein
MLKNNKLNKGFTIIEVLIVLAIAGLILLIVFLAVPALQRNSRNTTAKNDASQLLGAASEWSNNNNGKTPAASVSTTATSDAGVIFSNAKTRNLTKLTVAVGAGTVTVNNLTDATLQSAAKCPATLPAAGATTITTTTGAARQAVLLYAVESGSGNQVQCQESGL